jgi:hypothetical protein
VRDLGAVDISYGSPVLPGAMMLVGYVSNAECGIRNSELQQGKSEIRTHQSEIEAAPLPGSSPDHSAFRTSNSEFDLVPILGIPACGMFHKTTVIDLILPRLLAGERIGRRELAELGHGGMCLLCTDCRYPVCPFGK